MENPQVRLLDKSRSHATVHGERGPDDRDAGVHFVQDGLPLDAQGFLVEGHHSLQGETKQATKLREIAERKLKKAMKSKQRESQEPSEPGEEVSQDEDEDDDASINLEAWLRGEQRVEWNEISQTIAARYKRRVTSKKDAVEFLVAEKVIAVADLSREFKKFVD